MNRARRIARTAPLIALVSICLSASAAVASEGQLVIFPNEDGHFSLRVLLYLVALFGVLVIPVNALIFKPIFRVLDEREEKIVGTRRHADRLLLQAQGVLERYEQSVREVRQDAERERRQTLDRARADGNARAADARGDAEREMARAREQLAAALDEARAALRAQSEDLARAVAARALGRTLS